MNIPKVFISYSHDSQYHKRWVLDLATRLRNNGIDAILDQWELQGGDDLPHFMETHLELSDRILMICTDRYVRKANSGVGGVGYEKMIITSDFLKRINSNKVIPIIRQQGTYEVPTFLGSKLFINMSNDDEFEFVFDELLRTIHKEPLFTKPPIGNNPFIEVGDLKPKKANDAFNMLILTFTMHYDNGQNWITYTEALKTYNNSRILFDLYLNEAINGGYLQSKQKEILYYGLTKKGIFYAAQNNLYNS